MRPHVGLALALLLSASALANPFRDLYLGAPEAEMPAPALTPIVIDTPLDALPPPPVLDLDRLPALPAVGGTLTPEARIRLPNDAPTFELGLTSSLALGTTPDAPANSSLLRASDPRPVVAPDRLLAPHADAAPDPTAVEAPEVAEPSDADLPPQPPALTGVEVLAVATGERPSVLLTHEGSRLLLRVGQTLPDSAYRLASVTDEHVTFEHDEDRVTFAIRRDGP